MGTLTQGMFLASEAGQDEQLPSFFEVFMQDRINQSLKPALKYVVMVLMERYPSAFVLVERFDELYALLAYTIERHYMHWNDAMFAESLYGFKRSRYVSGKFVDLGEADRKRALLITVLIPFIKSKLDALYAKWTAERLQPSGTGGWRRLLRELLMGCYPGVHACYEGVFFFYQWAYLLGFRKYYSPLLELSGQVVRRLTREDLEKRKAAMEAASSSSSQGSRSPLTYLKAVFLLAVIGFKVLEWLHATAPALAPRTDGMVPPVPDKPTPAAGALPLPQDPSTCPLCGQQRVNPALSTSGVAFCYRCILTHVRDHGKCPVTLQRCREEQIRKLYLS